MLSTFDQDLASAVGSCAGQTCSASDSAGQDLPGCGLALGFDHELELAVSLVLVPVSQDFQPQLSLE